MSRRAMAAALMALSFHIRPHPGHPGLPATAASWAGRAERSRRSRAPEYRTPKTRELARLERRKLVDAGAQEYVRARTRFLSSALVPVDETGDVFKFCMASMDAWKQAQARWAEVLASPKPWTRSGGAA